MEITGAELFVNALKAEQVDTLFAYPGGQAIDLFNALYNESDIDIILPRHEQGLIHAADGYARSTGKPGVCLVTSGPGAANLVTGIATAHYDCVPLVCFTGQVPTHLLGKHAFQEVNMVDITRSICKYAVMVHTREELADIIQTAFYIAKTGRPGVVVVDLPKDIQTALGSDYYSPKAAAHRYHFLTSKPMKQMDKALQALNQARKPLFLVGGGVNIARAGREMTQLAELTGVPVITTIMGKGAVPTTNELYVGNIGIHGSCAANYAVSQCDVLFSIGTRFNDRITGKAEAFAPNATIIHIDIDETVISRNVPAHIPIVADAKAAIASLLEKAGPLNLSQWRTEINGWKKKYPIDINNSNLSPQAIIQTINELFPDSIIVTDVGQNQLWTSQFLEMDGRKQLLTSGGLGTMGYGFPAAIGAKIGNPKRDVILVSGDGGFQMNIQEMATAVAYELPMILCILNNGYLGNVRQWQELFYDRHYSCTCMQRRRSCPANCSQPGEDCPAYTPDFKKLAESYGAYGILVQKEDEIKEALICAKQYTQGHSLTHAPAGTGRLHPEGYTLRASRMAVRPFHKVCKAPVVIEFIIDRECNVMPIVPPGNSLENMILE